jgi:hypothetical protein
MIQSSRVPGRGTVNAGGSHQRLIVTYIGTAGAAGLYGALGGAMDAAILWTH